jgi:hypothetical protein
VDIPDSNDSPFAPWANDRKYTGLRFNWSSDTDSVLGAISDSTTVLGGTEFSLYEIFDHYNQAIGGLPGEEGYDSSGGEGDALWNSRTGVGEYDSLYFNIAYTNRMWDTDGTDAAIHDPKFQTFDWKSENNHLAVLGGLMNVSGFHTNTDMAGFVEDEYYIQCTVMVEGWEEF